MSDSDQLFSIEIFASARRPNLFEWVVRRKGRVFARSDRFYATEQEAARGAERELEREARTHMMDR